MKKKIYSFILLFLLLKTATSQNPNYADSTLISFAQFEFETEVIDYGTVNQYSDGNRELKFKNIGNEPLLISTVLSSCGCLVASWPKEPIMPGESGKIVAHYHTERVGTFQKTLTIRSNDQNRPNIVIKVIGNVLPVYNFSDEINSEEKK